MRKPAVTVDYGPRGRFCGRSGRTDQRDATSTDAPAYACAGASLTALPTSLGSWPKGATSIANSRPVAAEIFRSVSIWGFFSPDSSSTTRGWLTPKRQADVRRITFHELRHTFGTRMAANSEPLRTIQHWMGHADAKTTQVYAHHQPGEAEADTVDLAFTKTRSEYWMSRRFFATRTRSAQLAVVVGASSFQVLRERGRIGVDQCLDP